MDIQETAVRDLFLVRPHLRDDSRGLFFESFKEGLLAGATGHVFVPRQVNYSVSRRNTLRGIHGVVHPPSQAKYVTCVRGAVLDVVVDLRLGSPTFGAYETTVLDERSGTSLYIAEGLAHGFLTLTDDAWMNYLCSTEYEPGTQFDINPFDPELAIPWPLTEAPVISDKDATAPSLAEAIAAGTLPDYDQCLRLYAAARRAVGDERSSTPAPAAVPRVPS
ncbi:dTDP-4-dehydrorhamnose 3,5-epimerase [Streptomyces sp. CB03234]|uniref:dTDP-4-dehydrorhamnose 3,5-epimerase family protein n=1 Tax=Streptomyces sp. (strain CB03234) TaxID=1703937 RepID=UPI00093B5207|nr:dTDP-4-dehydrorhamnose 3,5-epimerase [Streptomyces sp. CB03234]OKJ94680.1 dTDP-4-dehydrorhamnose 3,5-epimerase [Streptomyces sp. CB03234]